MWVRLPGTTVDTISSNETDIPHAVKCSDGGGIAVKHTSQMHCKHYPLPAGLSTASNQFMQDEMAEKEQKRLLLQYTDQLRLSMAGNLQDFQTESFEASAW